MEYDPIRVITGKYTLLKQLPLQNLKGLNF